MRTLLVALFLARALQISAQESEQDKALRRESENIAAKLYPDILSQESKLMGEIVKLENVMKARNSTIFDMPQEPLIVAACAADILRIQPKWDALSEDEKETAYYSFADAMVFARDLAPLDAESKAVQKPPISIGAFDCYLYELTSGPTDRHGAYVSGPAAGLDKDLATVYAKQQWLKMADEQKTEYERMAEETGDPILQKEQQQSNAPVPVQILQGQGQ